MRKKILLLGVCGLLATATLSTQEFRLQPVPQEYSAQNDSISIPEQYQLLSGNSMNGESSLSLLHSLLPGEVPNATFRIYIGVKGDKVIKKYLSRYSL